MGVQMVHDWFFQTEMERHFIDAAAFADEHCMVFEPELNEHKLVYTDLHNQFRRLFEDKLHNYLASIGHSPEAFYEAFQKTSKVDPNSQSMADLMWCALDYEFFCQLMCERKLEMQKKLAAPVG